MLIESVPGEALSFHVIPFDNPRLQYTLQVTLSLTSTLCTTVNALRLNCACQISPKMYNKMELSQYIIVAFLVKPI